METLFFSRSVRSETNDHRAAFAEALNVRRSTEKVTRTVDWRSI